MRPGQARVGLRCDRCGCATSVDRRRPGKPVGCNDCRVVDPAYFRAAAAGVRLA